MTEIEMNLAQFKDYMDQLKYWRVHAALLSQSLREQKKQHEKELSETLTQLAYWREIALENQSHV